MKRNLFKIWNNLKIRIGYILLKLKIKKLIHHIHALYNSNYALRFNKIAYTVLLHTETKNGQNIPIRCLLTFSFVRGNHSNDIYVAFDFNRNIYPYTLDINISSSQLFGLTANELYQIFQDIYYLNNNLANRITTLYNNCYP